MAALENSGILIPKALWYSDNPEILGAPFFICSKCDGDPPLVNRRALAESSDRLLDLVHQFCDTLGVIHTFDWSTSIAAKTFDIGVTCETAATPQADHWRSMVERVALRPYLINT